MESILFQEQSTLLGQRANGLDDKVAREVYAGRKFRPAGIGSAGDFEGVVVTQYRDTAPPVWHDDLGGEPTTVNGLPAVRVVEQKPATETWWVLAEPDIVVVASRRELLDQSLARTGAPAVTAVAQLGWNEGIGWDAQLLLVRRFDRSNLDDCFSPFGTKPLGMAPRGFDVDGFLLEVHEAGPDPEPILRIRSHTRDIDNTREWLASMLSVTLGEGHVDGEEWSVEQPLALDGDSGFHMLLTFGWNIML